MDKTNVLSDNQKLILATLYVAGMREITIQKESFALWNSSGEFANEFSFKVHGFDFSNLIPFFELHKKYSLSFIIKEFCPYYALILNL